MAQSVPYYSVTIWRQKVKTSGLRDKIRTKHVDILTNGQDLKYPDELVLLASAVVICE